MIASRVNGPTHMCNLAQEVLLPSGHRHHLHLHYRPVPPPPAGLAGVGRGGEPDLRVEFSIIIVFSLGRFRILVAVLFFGQFRSVTRSPSWCQWWCWKILDFFLLVKEDCLRNICLGCYVLDNDDSYSRLPATRPGCSVFCP